MLNYFLKRINNKKGFTLVELVVVIAILGILAAIAVPRFTSQTAAAKEAALAASVKSLNGAIGMYIAEDEDTAELDVDTAAEAIGVLEEAGYLQAGTDDTGIDYDKDNYLFTVAP